ncbi:MAG: hemin ABC transporter substrate-binding protein [Myxococcales bacterium]|nr:hemin ABC transporter substrate-binding protein [Myxococcales bacterium]MDD9966136.1 hemin ABC transporter substrate-binding protein [Myxococcales bacterium]
MFRRSVLPLLAIASLSCARTPGDPGQASAEGTLEAMQAEGAQAAQPPPIDVVDAHGKIVRIADSSRVIAVGGGVTEIVYALGAADHLVGVDTSSVYPEAATHLPQVGYQRRLSAEGVLALTPTLVVASTDAGPAPAVAQIVSAGVPVLQATADHTIDGAKRRIRTLAQALGRTPAGERLVEALDEELATAVSGRPQDAPEVLFIYARGHGTVNVAGRDTAADEMIRLAGAHNAVTAYDGYKPLTSEAAVAAAPDVILLPSRGVESLGGAASVLELPGLSLTPAGKARRVVQMDDLMLLGFGPRTGRAVSELIRLLHGNDLPQALTRDETSPQSEAPQ